MRFHVAKLDASLKDEMESVAFEQLDMFRILPTTAYVFLEKNQKFVAVKKALDFFSENELEKMAPYQCLYFQKEKKIFDAIEKKSKGIELILEALEQTLSPRQIERANFETSRLLRDQIASIWDFSSEPKLDPLFAVYFVERLLGGFSSSYLKSCRELDSVRLEAALVTVSVAVSAYLFVHPAPLSRLRSWTESSLEAAFTGNLSSTKQSIPGLLFRLLSSTSSRVDFNQILSIGQLFENGLDSDSVKRLEGRIRAYLIQNSSNAIAPEESLVAA